MALISFGSRRALLLLSAGAVVFGGLIYGCSDDAAAPPATTTPDAGAAIDTGPLDTGPTLDTGPAPDTSPPVDAAIPTAVANLQTTSGISTVTGTATFVRGANGTVTATIQVAGADPGLHGLHIHVNGDCSDVGDGGPASGAGGHWNPDDAGHAFPDAAIHHAGDLGNVAIDDAGVGSLTISNPDWTIAPGTYSVVGHAVVFHASPDDGTTQPTGASGGRLACGVIVQTK